METGLKVSESVGYLRDNGLPNYVSTERAITVIARMADFDEKRSYNLSKIAVKPEPEQGSLFSARKTLLEPEAMAILKKHDIAAPEFVFTDNSDDAVIACRSLGYPVVMKVVSPEILHKSDSGGVILNILDDNAASAAFNKIAGGAGNRDFRGVIIYPMIKGGQEVIIGLKTDAQFGPVVIFGLGGIYTEVLQDYVVRVAPVSIAEGLKMITEIRGCKILEGARGSQPVDLESLAETIARFSQLPFIYPDLGEADLNPVFALPEGAVAGDVRLIPKCC
jgi:acyl-CoA synthetase (NDP forming)